ncbi:hypothetical protein RGV33_13990 [Pseudomonas sp. Bout1]|uniref:hypothetical protein n=1 Tax=Pseudomonas sp. Bout1 TaxID=3048600 RepID=UPI002AB54009|nr:hypothetical protein [Pseudomonas sp. Bout1]MDY7532775.1 hypothetical protein [Pseudomonas sp. Bout1]MEB0185106.1 hypothetical protein [Pseudomonas sp. Bout1]
MNQTDAVTGKAHIDYTRDTLFGPLPRHAQCQVSLSRSQPGGWVLQVFQPLPEDLHDAQTIVLALLGRRTSGVVRDRQRLADHSLRLELEPQ